MSAPNLTAPAAACLHRWHAMVDALDLSEVGSLLAQDVEFSSPAYWKPYVGRTAVAHVLQTAMGTFADFAYHRQFATGDGNHVVLEFSARIGDLDLKGIDMIAFDSAGLMTGFEVMVRPMKSLAALAERMRESLDLQLMGLAPKAT
ncbi:MAG: nuclear transport factor 2 family protein [Sporichthyaceae bacterium]